MWDIHSALDGLNAKSIRFFATNKHDFEDPG